MRAIYLKDNEKIVSGQKTTIATCNKELPLGEYSLVVKLGSEYHVPGSLEILEQQVVAAEEFDKRVNEHKVTKKQRMQWWPDAESFYLYPTRYSASKQTQVVEIAPGATMVIELKGLGLKQIANVDGYYIYEVE